MMELKSLSKSFDGKPAIRDLSLAVEDDEYLTLLGPSGSGKTTLLRLMAGLERPGGGQVLLNGEDVTFRPTHMRGLGFVQQNYALFPHMTVEENVGFGLMNRATDPVTDSAEVTRRVGEMLELVGLEGLGDRMVGQISGGQKQRVSLARTLITQPKVCLLDEPLGALDANLREQMTLELRKIREALAVPFFHVTGNESEALAMGDRMIVLDAGRALQIDPPELLYDAPATLRVARFLNAYNLFSGATDAGVFTSVDLRVPVPHGARPESAAVRFDKPVILAGDAQPEEGASLKASFVASEFMGSKVVYFFRRPGGGIVEVERHLSSSDPEEFEVNQPVTLAWNASDSLFFDRGGDLIPPVRVRGAA